MSDWHGWYLEVEQRLDTHEQRLDVHEQRLGNLDASTRLRLATDPATDPRLIPSTGAGPSRASRKFKHEKQDALVERLLAIEMQLAHQDEQAGLISRTLEAAMDKINWLEKIITSFLESAGGLLRLLRARERAPGE